MSSNMRSLVVAALAGIGLASTLTLAACRSIHVTPTEIIVEGDDGETARAKDLEGTIKDAMDKKAKAEARGDKAAAADWAKIIENLTAKKKQAKLEVSSLIEEGNATGTVTQSTDENGGTVYEWLPADGGVSGN